MNSPFEQRLKVSVIIPTYNRAHYLREALASVFAQTLTPWEVIVIDDGSTDDTGRVIQQAPGPVRFIPQPHGGVAAARNLGLTLATGDLIAWLDSDDMWEAGFLATVVALLARDRAIDGVYTGLTMVDEDGNFLRAATRTEPWEKLYAALVCANFLATPSLVVRKECYERVGGFDPQFRMAEDADMWLRLSKRFRIEGIPQALVRIRIHAANTMLDVDAMVGAQMALVRKHYGELEPGRAMTSRAAAAYAFAYRSMALTCIEGHRPTEGWSYLAKAAALYPAILSRLDTFYELALGDQPRGRRGDVHGLPISAAETEMLQRLGVLFATADPDVRSRQREAYGNAYVALGMLSDQAGDWDEARRYLARAVWARPASLLDRSTLLRLAKLLAGRNLAGAIRLIRSHARVHTQLCA